MIEKLRTAVKNYGLFTESKTVTVALSGGADSVALLHALLQLKDEFGLIINAAHLNHGIRGDEADQDEAFVKAFCKDLGVELFCQKVDIPKIAQSTGESLELAARNVRYEFLNSVSKGVIATAHTASDNFETLLFNVSRGTGLKGICGIPAKRDNIVRPLILATRSEIEDYCSYNNLRFCTDSTNRDDCYARNRIRLNVVPELLKVNNGAVLNALRLCGNAAEDEDYIASQVEKVYDEAFVGDGLSVEILNGQHISLRKRMIARLCKDATDIVPEQVHIDSICDMLKMGGNRVSFKCDYEATVRKGVLRLEKKAGVTSQAVTVDCFPFCCQNVSIERKVLENINSLLLKNVIDCDKICGELVLRHRMPGDSIKLLGRGVTKTLKKLFNESDLSAEEKSSLWVLSDDKGVLWVEKYGICERISVDSNTKCVIMINVF